jgi:hypothetical protein
MPAFSEPSEFRASDCANPKTVILVNNITKVSNLPDWSKGVVQLTSQAIIYGHIYDRQIILDRFKDQVVAGVIPGRTNPEASAVDKYHDGKTVL